MRITKPRFPFSSLRTRLMVLVLLAAVPAFGLTLYTDIEGRRRAAEEVEAAAVRTVKLVASGQEHLIEDVRRFLIDVAELPEVRTQRSRECNERAARLLQYSPSYANIGAVSATGRWFCSALPLHGPASVADRAWFQRTVRTRAFAVGEYQVDTIANKAVVHFGYPVLDDYGRIQAVVTAGLDLVWLNERVAGIHLSEGMSLLVADHSGIILARYPEPEKWLGRAMPETSVIQAMLVGREGVQEVTGVDGTRRVYTFAPVQVGSQPAMFVSIGVPRAVAFAEIDRVMTRNLTVLGLVTLLAVAAARAASNVFVLRHVKALVEVTKWLAGGDLTARTGLSHGVEELSQLGRAFDDMATSLERGEAERARAEEQLREYAERLQVLSHRLVEIQENERRRLARELHDEMGQILTGLKLILRASLRVPPDQVEGKLKEAQALLQDLMGRTRELSFDLRPALLDDLGLLPAMLWQIERYTGQTHVRVSFHHHGLERRLPREVETAAYRVVQEALTNVARHANVSEVNVRVWANHDRLSVRVEDAGTGFDPQAALAGSTSSGLIGMRERAILLGGQVTLVSTPGAGTCVTAEIPLDHPTEEGEGKRHEPDDHCARG